MLAFPKSSPTPLSRQDDNGRFDIQSGALADYARKHAVSEDFLRLAGWRETVRKGRPAISFPTATGHRYRFTDQQKPKFDQAANYVPCWYGLDRALNIAQSGFIILTNGAASVLAAQYLGLPAFAPMIGEPSKLPSDLLTELTAKYPVPALILIAPDNDLNQTGIKSARKRAAQLVKADYTVRILDLGLTDDKADLADFCGLHGTDSLEALHRCGNQPLVDPNTPASHAKTAYDRASYTDLDLKRAKDDIRARLSCYSYMVDKFGPPPLDKAQYGQWLAPHRTEDTPSLTSYKANERGWKDYGGDGKGGDIFALIMLVEHCDFWPALHIAAELTNVELPKPKTFARAENPKILEFPGTARTAPQRHSATTYNPTFTLGEMVERLNRDASKAAADLPKSENRSRRSTFRDRSAKNRNSIDTKDVVIKSGIMAPGSHFPTTWIRNVFPLNDSLTALVPVQLLTSELFTGVLTEDEIENLQDQPFMMDLTQKQRFAVKQRMKLLAQVKRLVDQLKLVNFVIAEGQHFDNPAALRREVLRQVVSYFATDPTTGKRTESQLSNAIQACLLGCTIGALPLIRMQAGVEQLAAPKQEKLITLGQRIPDNAISLVVRNSDGLELHRYSNPRAAYIPALLEHARAQGQIIYALVQPVSHQRIIDMPEATSKVENQPARTMVPMSPTKNVSEKSGIAPAKLDGIPSKPRRSWREIYAARLCVCLLHHANVAADESEPVGELADKLRSLIKQSAGAMVVATMRNDILIRYRIPIQAGFQMTRLYAAYIMAGQHGEAELFLQALDEQTCRALLAYADDEEAPIEVFIESR